jgi:hypothetical protein
VTSSLRPARSRSHLPDSLALALAVAALAGCATPQDRRVPESERTWHCSLSRPLLRGRIEASVVLTRTGAQQEAIRFSWRRDVGAGSIELRWFGTPAGVEPYAAAQSVFSIGTGRPSAMLRRLELRRLAPDGAAGETVFASTFERLPRRVLVYWRDVTAAARDDAFLAVIGDSQGRVLVQTRIDRSVLEEPGRAAAILQPQLRAMMANYEQSCRLSSDRGERVTIT